MNRFDVTLYLSSFPLRLQVSYHEVGPSRDDSNTLTTTLTNITLDALLPGRNYSITVSYIHD